MKYYNNGGNVGNLTAEESSLSSWAGPYVTEMLGRGAALASQMPYQAYEGPLTAGPSALQTQAYEGIGSLAMPTASTAGDFTGSTAQSYMSPYISASLEPQMAEAQRQAEIQRVMNASRLGKAGAFGGGRQAIMESEGQRNLLRNLTDIYGTGMQTAYEQGLGQFNKDRGYGLDVLAAQRQGGAEQRAIEQAGIAADIAQFEQERDYPYKQTQFMQSLLQGLPLETQSYSYYQPTGLQNLQGGLSDVTGIYSLLSEYLQPSGSDSGTTQAGQQYMTKAEIEALTGVKLP